MTFTDDNNLVKVAVLGASPLSPRRDAFTSSPARLPICAAEDGAGWLVWPHKVVHTMRIVCPNPRGLSRDDMVIAIEFSSS